MLSSHPHFREYFCNRCDTPSLIAQFTTSTLSGLTLSFSSRSVPSFYQNVSGRIVLASSLLTYQPVYINSLLAMSVRPFFFSRFNMYLCLGSTRARAPCGRSVKDIRSNKRWSALLPMTLKTGWLIQDRQCVFIFVAESWSNTFYKNVTSIPGLSGTQTETARTQFCICHSLRWSGFSFQNVNLSFHAAERSHLSSAGDMTFA